jgi:hypothetical protein
MPDDNRFAGIGADLDAAETPADEEPEAEADTAQTDAAPDDDSSADTVVSESTDEEGGPAFSFDETTAKSIYVREETLALLEDTEFEVEMRLRKDHSVRDVTGREFHDAAVHVLEDHVDEVVDAILEARDE